MSVVIGILIVGVIVIVRIIVGIFVIVVLMVIDEIGNYIVIGL